LSPGGGIPRSPLHYSGIRGRGATMLLWGTTPPGPTGRLAGPAFVLGQGKHGVCSLPVEAQPTTISDSAPLRQLLALRKTRPARVWPSPLWGGPTGHARGGAGPVGRR